MTNGNSAPVTKIELKTELDPIKTDITTLKSDVAVIKSDVADLKHTAKANTLDIVHIKTDIAEIKETMSTKKDMNRVAAKINDLLLLLRADRPRLAKEFKWWEKQIGGKEFRRILTGKISRRQKATSPSGPS
ncbi:MAG: hypothetical protein KKH28_06805 [Elusimicrobia bacterium]|nr:hypothetical protein [Elusimicrobiota bacterium]